VKPCIVRQDVWYGDAPRRRAVHATDEYRQAVRAIVVPPPGVAPEDESFAAGLDELATRLEIWTLDLSEETAANPFPELVALATATVGDRWGFASPPALIGIGASCASVATAARDIHPAAIVFLGPEEPQLADVVNALDCGDLRETPLLVVATAECARAEPLTAAVTAFPLASLVRLRTGHPEALEATSANLAAAWLASLAT